MRALVQRVSAASVSVDGAVVGEAGTGLLVLLGIRQCDQERDLDYIVEKVVNLRIFEDEDGRLNRSLLDVDGELLVVSQFTLFAETRRGRRPGFSTAAVPEKSEPMYNHALEKFRGAGVVRVEGGRFGAHMEVSLVNDGPVTIMIDSEEKFIR